MLGFPSFSQLGLGTGLLILLGAVGCGGNSQSLTDAQRQKLDPPLRSLLKDENPEQSLSASTRSDGTDVYAVFIRTTDAARVREAGLPINSASGNVLTARLSTNEIRQAARLDAVTRIRSSGTASPHAE